MSCVCSHLAAPSKPGPVPWHLSLENNSAVETQVCGDGTVTEKGPVAVVRAQAEPVRVTRKAI